MTNLRELGTIVLKWILKLQSEGVSCSILQNMIQWRALENSNATSDSRKNRNIRLLKQLPSQETLY